MRTIVFNSSNIQDTSVNNTLVYKFPNSVQFKNNYIALQSATMYYSWFNISASLGNNQFSFQYHNASGGSPTFQVITFPDGIYDVSTMNQYIQFVCLQNGWYMTKLVNGVTNNVFFVELELNISKYAVQINCYTVPNSTLNTSSAVGYLAPTTGTTITKGFPGASYLPMVITNSAFNKTIGYPAGWQSFNYFGTSASSGTYNLVPYSWNPTSSVIGVASYLSNTAPNITGNSAVYIAITGINNPYALPSSIIYAISPSGGVGAIIVDKPPQFGWNKMIDGTYNQLTLTLLGQDFQPLTIKDPDMTFLFILKDGEEGGGK